MTVQEFKKTITKANWFDKYYYYIISFAIIGVGIFFFYLAFIASNRSQAAGSEIMKLFAALFFIALGSTSLYLIPNRYKILTIDNKSSIEEKKKIIEKTMMEFNVFFFDNPKHFWSFNYQRRWWIFDYNIYLTFDNDKILASVVGGTHGRGGFIDFGQTEKVRKKLISILEEKMKQG